ncbi:MAG: cobalamin-binding protein [Blastocatellia bacterium]
MFGLLLAAITLPEGGCLTKTAAPAGSRPFVDEIGRTIQVHPNPQRIVSLAPSITETLFALGIEDRLVGVTSYCDYPAEAHSKEKVGDTMRPSIERIVALKADLVIASTASQLEEFVHALDQVGIPVYVSNPRDVEGVLASIERIGELVDARGRAREVNARLRARMEAVQARLNNLNRPRVLFALSTTPLITPGGGGFIDDLINRAGGRSVSSGESSDYPQFSLETAVAAQPEVIFLQTGESELPDRLKLTPAAKAGQVFHLDDNLLQRPGPRIIDGLEQMAARIHPQAFINSEKPE